MYLRYENGLPAEETNLSRFRQWYKRTKHASVPELITQEMLHDGHTYFVQVADKPSINELTHRLEKVYPAESDNPKFVTWNVVDLTAQERQQKVDALKDTIQRKVQHMLDIGAQEHGYDSIVTLVSYATSGIPKFKAEAQAAIAWRDAVWSTVFQIWKDVRDGVRTMPTLDEAMAEMPTPTWPA